MDQAICELDGVSKEINGTKILDDVSFQIPKGQVTCLLGPNGAGKTTTIRILMNLLKPTTGTVTIFGDTHHNNSSAIRGRIGLLPQRNAGYKQLKTRDNLKFVLELNGISWLEKEPELSELLRRLDLEDVMEREFGKLSGGEARAMSFIRAVLTGKDLLILDEPTTGLDLSRAVQLRRIIQEEIRRGKTVLMSSHVITDLEELAQEIIILKKGRVVATGTRKEIQERFAPGKKLEHAIVTAFEGEI